MRAVGRCATSVDSLSPCLQVVSCFVEKVPEHSRGGLGHRFLPPLPAELKEIFYGYRARPGCHHEWQCFHEWRGHGQRR